MFGERFDPSSESDSNDVSSLESLFIVLNLNCQLLFGRL